MNGLGLIGIEKFFRLESSHCLEPKLILDDDTHGGEFDVNHNNENCNSAQSLLDNFVDSICGK